MAGTGLNGEVISGISLTVFGIMLVLFGTVNQVAADSNPCRYTDHFYWSRRDFSWSIYKQKKPNNSILIVQLF